MEDIIISTETADAIKTAIKETIGDGDTTRRIWQVIDGFREYSDPDFEYLTDGSYIYALRYGTLKGMRITDTFQNGRQVSPVDSGSAVELLTDKAVHFASLHSSNNSTYTISDYIYAHNDYDAYNAIVNADVLNECEDYVVEEPFVYGFTYFDGSKFNSIIRKSILNDSPYTTYRGEDRSTLDYCLKNAEPIAHEFARTIYKCGSITFSSQNTQDAWWEYRFDAKDFL